MASPPFALLLVVVAVLLAISAAALGSEWEVPAWFFAFFGVAVVWAATRPWHPVIAPLYRRALREAWTDWVEAVERWQAREDRKGADEAQRATDGVVLRLQSLRPPPAEREEHEALVHAVARYAQALRAWHAAPDDPQAAARLQAAHDALSAEP